MKKILSVLLAFLMCMLLFGCGKTDAPKPQQSAPSDSAEKTEIKCTVQIECKSILENLKSFKGDSSKLPQDGVILVETEITAENGATACDVLKAACEKAGIELDVQDSQYGKYVNAVSGIGSGDCGGYSGWLYSVNGESPNTGIGEYVLNSGDKLTLSYSC